MQVPAFDRCLCIRESFKNSPIPSEATELIIKSWREGTRKQYNAAWKQWYLWCVKRNCSPFYSTQEKVIAYMHSLFQDGKSHSVLNTHKSMLLQTLPFFGNSWCHRDTSVSSRYMKGVFNSLLPRPRYGFTWDISTVLKYLKTLYPLNSLCLKLLTFKTVALVALSTAPRPQTLVSLDLDMMKKEKNQLFFLFPVLLKTSSCKKKSSVFKIKHFQDERLCAMHTVLFYIEKTRSIRKSNKLFVSYVTFDKVTTSTIARWL